MITPGSLRRRRRFGVRQLAAALARPACRPCSGVRRQFGREQARSEKAAASCRTPKLRPEGWVLICDGVVTQTPLGSQIFGPIRSDHRTPEIGEGGPRPPPSPVGADRLRGSRPACHSEEPAIPTGGRRPVALPPGVIRQAGRRLWACLPKRSRRQAAGRRVSTVVLFSGLRGCFGADADPSSAVLGS